MKLLIVQIALFSLATCTSLSKNQQWEDFKLKFKKEFRDLTHESERKAIFESTLELIESHNKLYEKGLSTYKQGINQYSDWTWEEFQNTVLMRTPPKVSDEIIPKNVRPKRIKSNAPSAHDWRDHGVINAVKDQGHCGSCWAFGAVGSVEAAWARAGNGLEVLSEQELVDCGMGDCDGGWVDRAYDTIINKEGLNSEMDYPYEARNGQCRFDDSKVKATISDYTRVYGNIMDPEDIADSVYDNGPHAIYVYANSNFQRYSSGIFDDPLCSKSSYNHAIVNVGYDKSEQFWIVRNSWTTSWGEDGYMRIVMGKNTCNCEHYAWYPTI